MGGVVVHYDEPGRKTALEKKLYITERKDNVIQLRRGFEDQFVGAKIME